MPSRGLEGINSSQLGWPTQLFHTWEPKKCRPCFPSYGNFFTLEPKLVDVLTSLRVVLHSVAPFHEVDRVELPY